MQFMLPAEAQWEYACRAGTTMHWFSGDDEQRLREHGWFNANSGGQTHPVGQLRGNSFGLYDMHGNVWEWWADWHAPDFFGKPPIDDPPVGTSRVHRGEHWNELPQHCRSAHRHRDGTDYRFPHLGFRSND